MTALAFLFVAVVAAVVGAALSQDGTGESPVLSTHLDVMGVASHQEPDVRHNEPSVSQESSNEA